MDSPARNGNHIRYTWCPAWDSAFDNKIAQAESKGEEQVMDIAAKDFLGFLDVGSGSLKGWAGGQPP
jgi:hypothetical protein